MPSGDTPRHNDHQAAALDARLFTGPFVLIDCDNDGAATAPALEAALRPLDELDHITSVAGRLRAGVLGADVDPANTRADPEAGQAAAEELRDWAAARGLPWLVRASGRPDARHVLAVAPQWLAPQLAGEWAALCHRLAERHGTGCEPRTGQALRLLSAPHRAGLPAPVLERSLSPADLPRPADDGLDTPTGSMASASAKTNAGKKRGAERSRAEFRMVMARARKGWTPGRVFADVTGKRADSKAAAMGFERWRFWVWCKAVTLVAAEEGAAEDEAWRRFERASKARAKEPGLRSWREWYWFKALEEAKRERNRARRGDDFQGKAKAPKITPEQQAEVDVVRQGLAEALEHQAGLTGKRADAVRSVGALLAAQAVAIVLRDGAMSQRTRMLEAHLSKSTEETARQWAAERGLIYRAETYQGGVEHSDSWLPGPEAQRFIDRARETRGTRWYTPMEVPRGQADPLGTSRRNQTDRLAWRLRCELSAIAEATNETYAECSHPVAQMARSVWHQQRWWKSLDEDAQERRRAVCRARLGRMHRSERSAWLGWLGRRGVIVAAAERVNTGQPMPCDAGVLERAPLTVHLGQRDPLWRAGAHPPAAERPRAIWGAVRAGRAAAARARRGCGCRVTGRSGHARPAVGLADCLNARRGGHGHQQRALQREQRLHGDDRWTLELRADLAACQWVGSPSVRSRLKSHIKADRGPRWWPRLRCSYDAAMSSLLPTHPAPDQRRGHLQPSHRSRPRRPDLPTAGLPGTPGPIQPPKLKRSRSIRSEDVPGFGVDGSVLVEVVVFGVCVFHGRGPPSPTSSPATSCTISHNRSGQGAP